MLAFVRFYRNIIAEQFLFRQILMTFLVLGVFGIMQFGIMQFVPLRNVAPFMLSAIFMFLISGSLYLRSSLNIKDQTNSNTILSITAFLSGIASWYIGTLVDTIIRYSGEIVFIYGSITAIVLYIYFEKIVQYTVKKLGFSKIKARTYLATQIIITCLLIYFLFKTL